MDIQNNLREDIITCLILEEDKMKNNNIKSNQKDWAPILYM
jgi:hypothetical protein